MKLERILIFHPYLATYRLDLYNKLAENYDLNVLLTGSKKEISGLGFDLKNVNSSAKFRYQYCTTGIRIGRHLLSWEYLRYFINFKPSIVFAHELGINTFIAIIFKSFFKYKLNVTVDDSYKMATNYGFLRNLLRNIVVKYSDKMIVVNTYVQSYLASAYPINESKFIYFPIIQDDEILKQKISAARTSVIIDEFKKYNKIYILFVGRLEEVKSPLLLLESFKEIVKIHSNIHLFIVGDGSLRKSLEYYVLLNKLNNVVTITGKKSGIDLYPYYNLAHIFVLPSNFEPFGAVVNEALISGCYTIVSDVAGASSLINNQNGSIFKSGNLKDLSEKINFGLQAINIDKKIESKMEKSFNNYYIDLCSHF